MCSPKSNCLIQGEEDFVMRGEAGKKTNKQDLISRGREQTSRQSMEPEKRRLSLPRGVYPEFATLLCGLESCWAEHEPGSIES